MKRLIFNKFSRFFYGGLISYSLRLGITTFLTEIFNIWYFLSYIIALSCAITVNFFFNAYITFKIRGSRKIFVKYIFTFFIFMLVDAFSVRFLTDFAKIYYLISIIIVTTVLFVVKFFIYDKLVFVRKNMKNQTVGEGKEV